MAIDRTRKRECASEHMSLKLKIMNRVSCGMALLMGIIRRTHCVYFATMPHPQSQHQKQPECFNDDISFKFVEHDDMQNGGFCKHHAVVLFM